MKNINEEIKKANGAEELEDECLTVLRAVLCSLLIQAQGHAISLRMVPCVNTAENGMAITKTDV